MSPVALIVSLRRTLACWYQGSIYDTAAMRGDGRGRAASTAGPQGVQKLTLVALLAKKSADAAIASVSMRSQSTLALESVAEQFHTTRSLD